MLRPLVVECEPSPVVADPAHAGRVELPFDGGCIGLPYLVRWGVVRAERVQPERMLQVGEQQLLVLLLMVQTELDERNEFSQGAVVGGLQEREHPLIDSAPVSVDLGDCGTRQQPAGGARPARRQRRSRS